jgi:hypothetical protein
VRVRAMGDASEGDAEGDVETESEECNNKC